MKKFLLFVPLIAFFLLLISFSVSAQENKCTNTQNLNLLGLTQCLADLEKALNLSRAATAPLESQLNSYQLQINGIKKRIAAIEANLIVKQSNIQKSEKDLAKQTKILNETVVNHYISNYLNNFFSLLLSGTSATNVIQNLAYQKAIANRDKAIIINIALSILDLKTQKENLSAEQVKLTAVKATLDEQSAKLDKIVSGAKAYQGTLSSQIAQLSARQQQILGRRLTDLGIPRSAAASALYCTDDRKIDPGFGSGFAFFTFGIPHYVGLNQYGAYGRHKAGQDYKTILNAYFQNISVECRDLPAEIDVEGFGKKRFEEYIKGVVNKEMGADLSEALKAQAIAARSYALVQTDNATRSICATQRCQVYSDARRGAANDAVDATGVNACGAGKGEVVVSNGSIANTWYASTFGGYTHRSSSSLPNAGNTSYTKEFADTRAPVNSFSDLFANAYDNESACFYTAQGWRKDYKNSAWLRQEEVADIVNVILLARADSSTKEKLYQTDKPHPYGGEVWGVDRVKSELKSRNITPFESVTNVVADGVDFGSGRTTNVTVSGNTTQGFGGSEFKDWFNLRAPANIQIVGPLYNVERR